MPLLTTTQQVNATIADLGRTIASHLAAAAQAANKQAAAVLALSNDDLASWLNEQGADAEALFAAHAMIGASINIAAAVAHGTLSASGIDAPLGPVDVRPVSDQLLSQNRKIVITESGATIADIPQPEPEPEPEA